MAGPTDINRGAPVLIAPRPSTGAVDPKLARKGGVAHRGGILVSAAALLFFAYVFNLGGLQGWLNGSLQGVDHSVRSHNDDVAAMVKVALPYVAIGVGSIAGLFMLNLLLQLFLAGPSKKPKARAKKNEAPAPAAIAALAGVKPPEAKPAAEPAVLVRPYRPAMPSAVRKDVAGPRPVETLR